MNIKINSVAVTQDLSVIMKTEIKSGLTMIPSSVNPVLKSKLEIQLDSNFPFTLERGEFSVNAT
jgi:hypothetical protein